MKILTARGSLNESLCLVNYYPVCQTGTAMVPFIDGREYHFRCVGDSG
ncbi:hypothetical protein [Melghirimyces thermohalophilus]|nr:hypothetical protein [Melghirimyces thermohalophilus]